MSRSALPTHPVPAPCQAACPAGIDVPSYTSLIAHGRYREAVDLIRQDNPFPWVCGLICPHPCERACAKGYQDAPLSIRALKGFVASAVEKLDDEALRHRPSRVLGKVAVVGSGPAGLSAAVYLADMDYDVTVFEALPVAGGMMAVGIPEYRLPRDVLNKEIKAIKAHGVEIRLNTPIGGDLNVQALRDQGYQAIFLATGAHKPIHMEIDGEAEYAQVDSAVEFLRRQQIGHRERIGDRVVVIGGGNSAFDAARVSRRLGSKDVHVVYRRSRAEMGALPEEIVEAEEEGVTLHLLTIPVRIVGDGNKVTGVECLKAELGLPDSSGRQRPVPIRGSEFILPADGVIVAISQMPDLDYLSEAKEPVEVSRRGRIEVDPQTMATSVEGVFAGGDVVLGPATVIEAVAMGKRAAQQMDRYLRGQALDHHAPIIKPRMRVETVKMEAKDKVRIPPTPLPLVPAEERVTNFEQIELEWTEEMAREEAKRCLRCDICIGCGECAKVCRTKVEVDALRFTDAGGDRVVIVDMLRPQEYCIGCGSCVNVCPTGALSLVTEGSTRRLVKCGTTLAKLEMVQCGECGEYYAPRRFMDYVKRIADAELKRELKRMLCPTCARKAQGRTLADRSGLF